MYKYNLVNNKIDSKKLSCNFHLASFYLVNSSFRQSERESYLSSIYYNKYYKNQRVPVISHMYDSQEGILHAQIAALNLVLKSSNMRQIQKSTFSVKLTRIPFVFWNV